MKDTRDQSNDEWRALKMTDVRSVYPGMYYDMPSKSGQVWRDDTGREYLIVKDNGGVCTTLVMLDAPTPYTMLVECGRERYVNPGRVGYVKTSVLLDKTGTAVNARAIAEKCADAALGVNIDPVPPPETLGAAGPDGGPAELDRLRAEVEDLRKCLMHVRTQNTQMRLYEQLYNELINRLVPEK